MSSVIRGSDGFDTALPLPFVESITTYASGTVITYSNGWKRQILKGPITSGAVNTFPEPFSGGESQITLVGVHIGVTGTPLNDFNLSGNAINNKTYTIQLYRQDGVLATSGICSIIAEGF